MIATLAGQTLRIRGRSIVLWTLSLAALAALMLSIFPSLSKIDFEQLLRQYPEELKQAFGIESADLYSTAIGYLNGELFGLIFPLAIVFLPIGVVSHVLPAAEDQHFLESLLAAPVARWQVVVAGALAAAAALGAVLVALTLITMLVATVIGVDLTFAEIGASCLSLWPLGSLFGAVSLLVACAGPGRGRATGIAAGLLVLMYMMHVIAAFSGFFHDIRGLSAYHYYADWLSDGINWPSFAAMLLLAGALTALGALLFERRDIGT